MDRITELADRLGKEIAASPAAKELHLAREALHAETDLANTLKTFQDQTAKIAQIESEGKPVEVDDKHKLRDMHNKLVASATFKKFTAAQVAYVDMMRKVNEALQRQIGQAEDGKD